jgi:hypothetical protein
VENFMGVGPVGSKTSRPLGRVVALALSAALFAAGAAVVTAAPAAATTFTRLAKASWAYTDSAAPHTSFVNPAGTAPIGAHTYADGTNHVSKSYLTFDLSALRGSRLLSSYLSTGETAVTDCANPRTTQVWLTDPAKKPTWDNPPAELVKLGGPYIDSSCPSDGLTWTATAAVQSALDAGRTTATFALRLPDDQQDDPQFGREYDPAAQLLVTYDRPPGKPSQLTVGNKACTAAPMPLSQGAAQLGATVVDPDDNYPSAEFAFWPVDHPDQRTTVPNTGIQVGNRVLVDIDRFLTGDVTYAWQVRGKDDTDVGPWSSVCKFATDYTRPDKAPTVSSTDYTEQDTTRGGSGIAGAFTFKANGVKDVTGYYYGFNGISYIYAAADHKGGAATISFTPFQSGPQGLVVESVDAAGNRSPETQYDFWVGSNEPSTTCAPASAYLGVPRQCTFSPRGNGGATAYVYQFGSDPATAVAAGPDGTATVTVTPTDPDVLGPPITVRTRLANGNLTAQNVAYLNTDPGLPLVDTPDNVTIGKSAEFTFHAVLPGSTTFTYTADGDPVTVPVGADGTAKVTVTPKTSGYLSLSVFSTTDTGQRSGSTDSYVEVATNQPTVVSTDYPENAFSGGVTVPGTFTFSSPAAGVVSYTYKFNDDDPVTVPAGPDGTVAVVLTPLKVYAQTLFVTSTFADGTVSEQRRYDFLANSVAPSSSCDSNGYVHPGQLVHCTFTAVQPGAVSYGYALGAGPETSVAAGADGAGAMSFTVPADQTGQLSMRVWSVNTLGLRSDELSTGFDVDPNLPPAAAGRAR